MTANGRSRRLLALVLALSGIACLAWSGIATLRALSYQRTELAALDQPRVESPGPPEENLPATPAAPPSVSHGEAIGSLEIPRLRFSVVVAEGDDDATLKVAAGHLPDTPLPWDEGNSALAGHRDGLFRPLEKIRVGDELTLSTPRGELRYRVSETKVVDPDDLSVLDASQHSMLTLITCYPFRYVGPAPRRFIVQAEAIGRSVSPRGM